MEDNLWQEEIQDLIEQLKEEIDGGFVEPSEELYVVRSITPKTVNGKTIYPPVDFYFSDPALKDELREMKIIDAKRYLYGLLENIPSEEDPNGIKEAIKLNIDIINDYVDGNKNRNNKMCYIVELKDYEATMNVYFEEDEISAKLSKIKAEDLLLELNNCLLQG